MKTFTRVLALIGIFCASLAIPASAGALQATPPNPACQQTTLPSSDPKYPASQLALVCIPPNFNGDLVLYAHGYTAPQLGLALPFSELTVGGVFLPEVLMAQGYAFATTSYHKNGYAVEQARKDLSDLQKYARSQLPPETLKRTFLVGASEGAEIATLMIERFPDTYAGALAMCGPIGGGQHQVEYLSHFRAVFDVYFPDVFDFGVTSVPETAFLAWTSYQAGITGALESDPFSTAQLLSVTGAAYSDPQTAAQTTASVLWYSIFATNDLLSTAGGNPFDNTNTIYSGSLDDTALNQAMERVESDGRAKAYLRRFYQPTGNLQRPLVTLHNTLDPVVPFDHEVIYQELAQAAGGGAFLTQVPVSSYGHCNFSITDVLGAFEILVLQAAQ